MVNIYWDYIFSHHNQFLACCRCLQGVCTDWLDAIWWSGTGAKPRWLKLNLTCCDLHRLLFFSNKVNYSLLPYTFVLMSASLVRPKIIRSVHYCPVTKKTMERKYTDMTSLDPFPSSGVYPTKVRYHLGFLLAIIMIYWSISAFITHLMRKMS